MKKKKNIAISGMIIGLLLICMLGFSTISFGASDKKKESFEIRAEYGYNGEGRYGRAVPVSLEITSLTDDFEGIVKIIVNEDSYNDEATAYMSELMLPAGSGKKISFLLPSLTNYSKLAVVIENDSGKTMFSKEIAASINMSMSHIQIGVLTDDFNALNYLDNLAYYQNSMYDESMEINVRNLTPNLFPGEYKGLDFFDILVISNYDTNKLEEEQYQTLKSWVNDGGILLLGTGASYQKTLGKFKDDYIIGTIGDLSTQSSSFGVEKLEEVLPISFDSLDISVEGSQVNEEKAFQMVYKNSGKVMVFDFDFGSSAFSDWKHNKLFFESVMDAIMEDNTTIERFYRETTAIDQWTLQNMISNTFVEKLPGIVFFVLILMLYLILIPIVYVVLKVMDKRQWIWGAVPVLSLLFALMIYGVGSSSRQKKPFLNYTSIITLQNTGAAETTYVAATSPQNKPYKIGINGNYFVTTIPAGNYYGYYSSDPVAAKKDYTVGINRKAEETIVEINNAQAFGTKYFEVTNINHEVKNVEIDLIYTKTGYKGTITNHLDYDLTGVGIIGPNSVLKFGDLKSGQTIKIEDEGEINIMSSQYEIAEFIIPYDDYTMSTYEKGISGTKRAILTNYSDMFYTSSYTDYIFVGFADDYIPLITENTTYDISGITVFKKNIMLGDSEDGSIFISDIASEFDNVIVSGEFDDSYGYLSMSGSEGVIEYTISEGLTIDWISMNQLYEQEDFLQIYFYNNENGSYEEVFQKNNQLLEQMEAFINEEGILRIKYVLDPAYGYYGGTNIPIFSAGLREKQTEE